MPARAERSPERLVFFSDAVVAIALTLLILPLADTVPEAVARHMSTLDLVRENQWKIYGFLLSFVVIARLWIVHHRVFEQVKTLDRGILLANFGWLLTVVVLPFATEMVSGYGDDDPFTKGFYIGTILAAAVFTLIIVSILRARPGIAQDDPDTVDRMFFGSLISTAALAGAFVLGTLVPPLSYYPLLLLLLNGPLERWRERRRAARAEA